MSVPDNTPGDSDPAINPSGDGVNVSDADVSQGRSGLAIVVVLIVSTVLVVIVLFAVFGLNAARKGATGPNGGGAQGVSKTNGQAEIFHTPEPSPKQNPAPTSGS